MRFTKKTFITGFALFSLFFGAGNLILPPYLGYKAGVSWPFVLMGFLLSAVVIPILAIYGHARIQGTMLDFAKKVSPLFALLYSIIVYAISVTLPAPRTASVAYEMAIKPYFEFSSISVSAIYFILVFLIVINRSKVMDWVGKFLTPGILVILSLVILKGIFFDYEALAVSDFLDPFTAGLLEGYQTFDAIGGVVVGAVIVVSLGLKGGSHKEKQRTIVGGGLLAGIGLLFMYGGMIYLGALQSGQIDEIDRTGLLTLLSTNALGKMGADFLAVLVSLACFTTAVGIITGTADFVKGITGGSQISYFITALIGCLLGVLMGQLDVHTIIAVAIPALMFIYPITIVLIVLNIIPGRWSQPAVFRWVVFMTIVCSIPDFLKSVGYSVDLGNVSQYIPLEAKGLIWVLPALLTFTVVNGLLLYKSNS